MPAVWAKAGGLAPWLCLGVVLWGLSIGAAYWDLRRRWLPPIEQLAWLILVAVVPGVGLLAYLFSKLLGTVWPLAPGGAPPTMGMPRVTLLKPAPAAPRTGTIVAADLVKETLLERPLSQSGGVRLQVVAGPHTGHEFSVETLPARFGRGGEAALRLDADRGVSRLHAEIYRLDRALRIRDLHSLHGTAVNGVRIDDQALETGDRIEIGHTVLLVTGLG